MFHADDVHDFFLSFGRIFGKYRFVNYILEKIWLYKDPILEQNLLNQKFKNPIGLSAGFDYNADLVEILPSVGFGFNTIGTLTHESYGGNPPPMLARLPKSQSLLVNKGFKNEGVNSVLSKLKEKTNSSPRGVSIGATNKIYKSFDFMVKDIVAGLRDAEKYIYFDYYELNISCPNLLNVANLKEQIDSPRGLEQALNTLSELHLNRPVFIKMPLEKCLEEIKALVDTALPFSFIKGLIFSNLAKDRSNTAFDKEEIKKAGKGNFSGKPVESKSNELLGFIYKKYHERFILIGVGGVFTAEDAYKKILLGASLVQLITGMVFMGPQQIGLINKNLAKLLRRDGYKNISEAIGAKAI
jgi:dihydroorotate dehydrogenase subfamily 2